MNTPLLVTAGCIGLVTALAHGYLGETRLLGVVKLDSAIGKRALRAVFHLSTFYWFVGALVLLAAPFFFEPFTGRLLALVVAFLYIAGAIGNFWLARGKHIGWALLLLAAVLASAGA